MSPSSRKTETKRSGPFPRKESVSNERVCSKCHPQSVSALRVSELRQRNGYSMEKAFSYDRIFRLQRLEARLREDRKTLNESARFSMLNFTG